MKVWGVDCTKEIPHVSLILLKYMGNTNQIGDLGEIKVIEQCMQLGYKVAIPFGHDWKYDLIIDRNGKLERVQVKTTSSNGEIIIVRLYTIHTTGRGRTQRTYQENDFDWIAVYDYTTRKCYFVPASQFQGQTRFQLRLVPTSSNRSAGINWASDFETW